MPFPKSISRSDKLFQMIHVDVWVPYRIQTHSGHRFFLTIVDDCSRMTWIYLLRLKSDVVVCLKQFLALINTQFDVTVKVLRSDNGSEFFNSECNNLFQSYGILHQSSCVHTPQQNGVVERKHRHILEVARAISLQGFLPLKFWGNVYKLLSI